MRPGRLHIALVGALMVILSAGCDGGGAQAGSPAEDKKMRDAFAAPPKRSELSPSAQKSYDAMKQMADQMKTSGPTPGATPPNTGG